MSKCYTQLDDLLKQFIRQQQMFFTASAASTGRINISPKGLDCLQILDDRSVAYLDLTGSGNETSAHLLENKRLTLMFCSFSGPPQILRLYGEGQVILPNDSQWEKLSKQFESYPGVRQIIQLQIDSIQTSCGFAVPLYDFVGQRDTLLKWADKKGTQGISEYQASKNQQSIDGNPTHLAQEEH